MDKSYYDVLLKITPKAQLEKACQVISKQKEFQNFRKGKAPRQVILARSKTMPILQKQICVELAASAFPNEKLDDVVGTEFEVTDEKLPSYLAAYIAKEKNFHIVLTRLFEFILLYRQMGRNRRNIELKMSRYGNVQLATHEEKNLDTLIAVLRKVIRVYEHNMAFFRTNPYTKAENTFCVDDFSRLQAITPQTLQYIAQHPDELVPTDVETGIHYGSQHYYPRHTLITNKQRIRDTYENRSILGFIHEIALQTSALIEKIDRFLLANTEDNRISGGYISSATYILQTTRHNLIGKKNELLLLADALTESYWIYKKLLPVDDVPMTELPMPTAVFMSLSPYRQIYDVMVQWYTHGVYDFSGEEFLLPLLINNQLYEYYNLFKLAEAIESNGYLLDKDQCRRFSYAVGHDNYRDTEHINTFVFTKEDSATITLYFQPVIWGHNYAETTNNGIALRRSTSLSIDYRNTQGNRSLRSVNRAYYTPDYILKCAIANKEAYIIADAKLSTYETVMNYQVEELAYKYQFSIHPASEISTVVGVLILYGKSIDQRCELKSVHDLYHAPGVPELWLTSLTESEQVTSAEQFATLSKVLLLLSCN